MFAGVYAPLHRRIHEVFATLGGQTVCSPGLTPLFTGAFTRFSLCRDLFKIGNKLCIFPVISFCHIKRTPINMCVDLHRRH